MDYRNDLAKARDKWLNSKEGLKAGEGETSGQFLRNRLERAFIAGWKAAEDSQKKGK